MKQEDIKHWGVEDFDNEANEQGIIEGRFNVSNRNDRDYSEEVNYKLEVVEDQDSTWFVRATITKSDARLYKEGDVVEFGLYKDVSIFELDSEVKAVFEEESCM